MGEEGAEDAGAGRRGDLIMIDRTLIRFERRRRAADYGASAALVASWGVGLWLVVNLVDVARLLTH
ncbi:hypothetical protein GCM10008174_11330 [Methylopila turkensis]|uniref:Uncharacterized protein n=1 Tax=Methylopila turkensis TaxID=1437816 RepID=A0A9W6N6K1_9HYPH|nr:hypothetical protein GCM10008174_11330 [Methylopila turkensis]